MSLFQMTQDVCEEEPELTQEDDTTSQRIDTDVIGQVDMAEYGEVMRLATEFDSFQMTIDGGKDAFNTFVGISGALGETDPDKGITPASGAAIAVAVESIRQSLGFEKDENWSRAMTNARRQGDKVDTLKLAKEGVTTFIADVVRSIIRAIERMAKWIADFFVHLFSTKSRQKDTLKSVEKKLDAVEKKSKAVPSSKMAEAEKVVKDVVEGRKPGPNFSNKDVDTLRNNAMQKSDMLTTDKLPMLKFQGEEHGGNPAYIGKEFARQNKGIYAVYAKLSKRAAIDEYVKNISEAIENVDHHEAWTAYFQKYIELIEDVTKGEDPLSGKPDNGVNSIWFKPYLGDYAFHVHTPDAASDSENVFKHLGAYSIKFEHAAHLGDQKAARLPIMSVKDAKRTLDILNRCIENTEAGDIEHLEQAKDIISVSARVLRDKFEKDPTNAHVGHTAITLANVFNSTYVSYMASVETYNVRVINDFTKYLAVIAGYEEMLVDLAQTALADDARSLE